MWRGQAAEGSQATRVKDIFVGLGEGGESWKGGGTIKQRGWWTNYKWGVGVDGCRMVGGRGM